MRTNKMCKFIWAAALFFLSHSYSTVAEEYSPEACAKVQAARDIKQQELDARQAEFESLQQTLSSLDDEIDRLTAEQKAFRCAEPVTDVEEYRVCQQITKERLAALDERDRLRIEESDLGGITSSLDDAIRQHNSTMALCSGCTLDDWLGEWSNSYDGGGNMILEMGRNYVSGEYNGKHDLEDGELSSDKCRLRGRWRHAAPGTRTGEFCFNLKEEASPDGDPSAEPVRTFSGFWRDDIDNAWLCDSGTDWTGTKVSN